MVVANNVRCARKRAGYIEGGNVAIEYRWAEDRYDRLPALAADLVNRHVTVIAAVGNTPAALAAKAATTTIPIVFEVGVDPVAAGLVASLARPGGNLTGVTNLTSEIGPKRLEMLNAVVPTAPTLALLVNPKNPEISEPHLQELQVAARRLGLQLHVLNASTDQEIDAAFATLIQLRTGGLVIGPDAIFTSRAEQLAALALRYRVPAIFQYPEFTAAGGLMSYGSDLRDVLRLGGLYTGRILKGEKPADLPVQQIEGSVLALDAPQTQQPGIKRTDLQQHDITPMAPRRSASARAELGVALQDSERGSDESRGSMGSNWAVRQRASAGIGKGTRQSRHVAYQ
jgi:putative tryptophan/tyrosine transport system substrate-binding protein